jgi:hypothetical protein
MRSFQFKRERPTFKTAHDFFKNGGFSTDPATHFLRGEQREAEIDKIDGSLLHITKQQFPRTQNLEYAILKAHLIVEYAITEFIRGFAMTAIEPTEIRFTFSQKLEIAYLLGFGVNSPIILPTVERLNKVRNQVAHKFVLDRAAVDEMLRINHEDYENFNPKSDRERIRMLRWICNYICGLVSGNILAAYTLAKRDEGELINRRRARGTTKSDVPPR